MDKVISAIPLTKMTASVRKKINLPQFVGTTFTIILIVALGLNSPGGAGIFCCPRRPALPQTLAVARLSTILRSPVDCLAAVMAHLLKPARAIFV